MSETWKHRGQQYPLDNGLAREEMQATKAKEMSKPERTYVTRDLNMTQVDLKAETPKAYNEEKAQVMHGPKKERKNNRHKMAQRTVVHGRHQHSDTKPNVHTGIPEEVYRHTFL